MNVLIIITLVIVVLHLIAAANHNESLNLKLDKIMASQEQFNQVITRIDEATNNIAADLRDLKDIIAGSGLSSEVEDQVLARLESAATKLEAVAAETPEEPEEPETPEA